MEVAAGLGWAIFGAGFVPFFGGAMYVAKRMPGTGLIPCFLVKNCKGKEQRLTVVL